MGADLCWVSLPIGEDTLIIKEKIRAAELSLLLDIIDNYGLEPEENNEKDFAIKYFDNLIDIVFNPNFMNRRDVGYDHYRKELVTGGMSWGDSPTESYDLLMPLADLFNEIGIK
jgi:hypothetical protein